MLTLARRVAAGFAVTAAFAATATAAAAKPFLDRFAPPPQVIASTVPANGDQNPYGVAVVKHSVGDLVRGDVLVSNFNDSNNFQGAGSTIMEVSPSGHAHVFAVVPPLTKGGVTGLTTALVALRSGFVVVGNLPAQGGIPTNASAGALTVLNPEGKVVERITAPDINGPWDMTAADFGDVAVLFVTNVLNGTVAADVNNDFGSTNQGTVDRIVLDTDSSGAPRVLSNQVIATGFTEHLDPNALVVGPTGVGLGRDGTLYVADSANSQIVRIPDALFRRTQATPSGNTLPANPNLNDPLGLAIAPGGDILTVNGGDGNIIETTPQGQQVALTTLIAGGGGDLFGLAVAPHGRGVYFVNDAGSGPGSNSLELLH